MKPVARWLGPFFLFGAACSAFLLQHCDDASGEVIPEEVTAQSPVETPGPVAPTAVLAEGHALFGDRDYVRSVFYNVFYKVSASADAGATGTLAEFDRLFDIEVLAQQHLFGRACNPLERGTNEDCNANLTNAALRGVESSAGREGTRIQLCRRFVANDAFAARAVRRAGGNMAEAPKAAALPGIVRLFYQDIETGELAQMQKNLANLDDSMVQNAESVSNRWQLLLLAVCETPEWQIL
jgi:hypothetical protein